MTRKVQNQRSGQLIRLEAVLPIAAILGLTSILAFWLLVASI